MVRSRAYEVLGLDSNASTEEIKAAYAELSKKYHPEENPKEFQEIHEAYVTLTRPGRNRNRYSYGHVIRVATDTEEFLQNKPVDEEKAENVFDFSGIEEAKQKEQEEELQRVINWLDDVVYNDKKIDHVLLKVILNYKKSEIIYHERFIKKLIDILQDAIVCEETAKVIKQYIRPWDTSLEDKRKLLNALHNVLQKREEEYRTKYALEERQEAAKIVLLVMAVIVFMLWIMIDFFGMMKLLLAATVLSGISILLFKMCRKRKSEAFSFMIASLVDFIILLILYFSGIYKWIMQTNVYELLMWGFGLCTAIFFAQWKKENN